MVTEIVMMLADVVKPIIVCISQAYVWLLDWRAHRRICKAECVYLAEGGIGADGQDVGSFYTYTRELY
jgi:hypothetical protein